MERVNGNLEGDRSWDNARMTLQYVIKLKLVQYVIKPKLVHINTPSYVSLNKPPFMLEVGIWLSRAMARGAIVPVTIMKAFIHTQGRNV